MNYFKRNSMKTWVIVILLVANIAIISSFLFQTKRVSGSFRHNMPAHMEMPAGGMNAFFIRELDLNEDQLIAFRQYRMEFQEKARLIQGGLEMERGYFIDELSKKEPNQKKIDKSIEKVGELHKQLKGLTAIYYLNLKDTCNPDQQEKLRYVFNELANPGRSFNRDSLRRMERPGRGRGMQRGPMNRNNQQNNRNQSN